MKTSNGSPPRRNPRIQAVQRAQFLRAFDRSGLSAAAFARQHDINYTTFCGWRHRRAKTRPSPGFVEVELAVPVADAELIVELGAGARLRIGSATQMDLAARLLHRLNTLAPC